MRARDWRRSRVNPLLEQEFRNYFRDAGFRRATEVDLVKAVAKRAVSISDGIERLSGLRAGSGLTQAENDTIDVLHQLKTVLEEEHDPALTTPKAFADFVAQVLVFGLLYAHRVVVGAGDSPRDRYRKIQEFWSNAVSRQYSERLRPFRALVQMLGNELDAARTIGTWYDDCRLLLAHVELADEQREAPDYHILYERFLTEFDPQTRFDFGAFYTHPALARYAVGLAKAVTTSELAGTSLYADYNKLIDPCCGTGTFLEQLIEHADVDPLPATLIGFEIMPAPYALANYRLAMLQNEAPNISLVLTNTLSDNLANDPGVAPTNLIQEEQATARLLARPPLTLVIGNPPSSDSSPHTEGRNFSVIRSLLDDFRLPEEARRARQNVQQQIGQNPFIWFLRWSCEKLLQSPVGVLVMVVPASFCERPSYAYARQWLTEHFRKIWVIDIDMDSRTGVRTSSLFNVQQGRTLLAAVRDSSSTENQCQDILYRSIAELRRDEKVQDLVRQRSEAEYLSEFGAVSVSSGSWNLRTAKSYDVRSYGKFWPLYPEDPREPKQDERYVFARQCSGVKFAPSSLFVHIDRNVLHRRCADIGNLRRSVQELQDTWFSGQGKPPADRKLTDDVRRNFANAATRRDETIVPYAYRPLTTTYALVAEPVLQSLARQRNSGTRYRPELISAYESPETIGIAIAPATKDIGDRLHRFASFCWYLPDNDLCSRNNARIFCNQYPEYKPTRGQWNREPVDNICPELLDALPDGVSRDQVVYYVYGILCSEAFLDAFEGALYTVADAEQRPRVPFPADARLFAAIAGCGKRLAEVEKTDSQTTLNEHYSSFEPLYDTPFRLYGVHLHVDTEEVELVAEDNRTALTIKPIPRETLTFEMSGYNVVQQWLKIHDCRYSRMEFSREQYRQLLRLFQLIEEQTEVIGLLDDLVVQLLSGAVALLDSDKG